jgi:hypothetical protein
MARRGWRVEVYLHPFFYLHARDGCMINATFRPLYTVEGGPATTTWHTRVTGAALPGYL